MRGFNDRAAEQRIEADEQPLFVACSPLNAVFDGRLCLRTMKRPLALGIALAAIYCGHSDPARPATVPAEATWAGGVDGGAWIQCGVRYKEPATVYECSIYSEGRGDLNTKGRFVFVRCDPNGRCTPGISLMRRPRFEAFDGVRLYLASEEFLVPDGEIDYPFGDRHGKRVTYKMGVQNGPERSY